MDTHPLILVTVVAEAVLRERLTREIMEFGATGFTLWEIEGRGSRGLRTGDIPGQGIRIETLVPADVADAILERAETSWFPNYAVVVWKSQVQVVRSDKYTNP